MSVIFGVAEPKHLILCGDRRLSTKEGSLISDDATKIQVINDHLAVASAGNAAIEKVVEIESSKKPSGNQTVETILTILREFYSKVDALGLDAIRNMTYCALIAGKGDDGNAKLISLSHVKGELSYQDVPMGLYSPADLDYKECAEVFVRNYKLHRDRFCELTVQEVSKKSVFVSPTGTIWTYDIQTGTGKVTEF